MNVQPIQNPRTSAMAFRFHAIQMVAIAICLLALPGCKNDKVANLSTGATASPSAQNKHTDADTVNSKNDQAAATAPAIKSPQQQQPKQRTQTQSKTKVTVKKPAFTLTRKGRTYNRSQLHKNSTLLFYAYQPDLRAEYVISHVRNMLTDEQFVRCKELALSCDDDFLEIIRKRAEILETASDDDPELESKLLNLKMDTADAVQNIRGRIAREILTDEQKITLRKRNEEFLKQQEIERALEDKAWAEAHGTATKEQSSEEKNTKDQNSEKQDGKKVGPTQ